MIAHDQPTYFPSDLLVAVSSKHDGTMLDRAMGIHDGTIVSNRTVFCDAIGINYGDVVYQRIIYGDQRTYTSICEVDQGATTKHTSEVVADALLTRSPGVALMLPVADCVGTVIYDPVKKVLALLHLGRHSTVAGLLKRMLDRLIREGSKAEDLIVWMSPNAHASHYVMEYFDVADDPSWQQFCVKKDDGYHVDLQGYNAQVCREYGVAAEHVHTSPVNTMANSDYFSHAAGDTSGRFAVVAMMR